jgi:hypothetical protein
MAEKVAWGLPWGREARVAWLRGLYDTLLEGILTGFFGVTPKFKTGSRPGWETHVLWASDIASSNCEQR